MKRTKRFKVFPEPANKYWVVSVILAPNERSFLNALARNHHDFQGARALFGPTENWVFVKGKKGKKTGELGTIYLNAKDLDGEIVAHECAHAAFEYCHRRRKTKFYRAWTKKGDETGHDQEVFCYAQGHMTDQVLGTLCSFGFELSKK